MKKVLIIEDDTQLRENTAELLELSNYRVYRASDGKQGIASAIAMPPDIIICDIMMPHADGYEVIETLSKNPRTKGLPFIFLSAKTDRRDVRKGMELGADDYLTKPFEEHELIGAIESRLAKVAILKERTIRQAPPNENKGQNLFSINELKNYIDDHGNVSTYQFGESIYTEGDHANVIYLVLSGMVKTHKLDAQGKEFITGIYKEDDFFGFIGFNKNTIHKEYATAIETTNVVGILKETFRKILEGSPELVLELMDALAVNLTDVKEQLLQMAYGSVRKKTASTLLRFAEKLRQDKEGNIHIMRSDLAAVAGMATETLIRTLSHFKSEGLISIKDRNIRILDLKGLQSIQ
ncbi:MAG: response regulator [Eudoraea sp.]|nr:response regulator [Muriicola sp.]NNE03197.1 response regulator [Eudoraea sp.]